MHLFYFTNYKRFFFEASATQLGFVHSSATGAVFALMKHQCVCQEMVRDLLLDLPLLSNPVILLCMNKELRNQCVLLLWRNTSGLYMEKRKDPKNGRAAREAEEKLTQ